MAARGFSVAGMGHLTVRLTQALLAQGARLCFGHDWRQHGILNSLCAYAAVEPQTSGQESSEAAILNILPWPEHTALPAELLARLEGLLEVREAGLPEELRVQAGHRDEPEIRAYLVSRGLTHLRHELTRLCGARIAIGGKTAEFLGRYPGILEESIFALAAGQPLYLVGLLGGAVEAVGRSILDGEGMPKGFGSGLDEPIGKALRSLRQMYHDEAAATEIRDPVNDLACDLTAAWCWLQEFGAERFCKLNGLSVEENRELLETGVEEHALALVLAGLRRLKG